MSLSSSNHGSSFGSPSRRFHSSSDEDLSSVSSHGDSVLLCASPSSSYDKIMSGSASPEKDHASKQAAPSLLLLPSTTTAAAAAARAYRVLHKYYGTADVSDRIGRTLSFLLLARLALSLLLATIEDEE